MHRLPSLILVLGACLAAGCGGIRPTPPGAEMDFSDVAVDDGWVAPVSEDFSWVEKSPDAAKPWIELRDRIDAWPEGRIADEPRRVWNLLGAIVVCDLGRGEYEAEAAGHVFNRLRAEIPAPRLIDILTPMVDGRTTYPQYIGIAALGFGEDDTQTSGDAVDRTRLLAKKLLGRALGKLPLAR